MAKDNLQPALKISCQLPSSEIDCPDLHLSASVLLEEGQPMLTPCSLSQVCKERVKVSLCILMLQEKIIMAFKSILTC